MQDAECQLHKKRRLTQHRDRLEKGRMRGTNRKLVWEQDKREKRNTRESMSCATGDVACCFSCVS